MKKHIYGLSHKQIFLNVAAIIIAAFVFTMAVGLMLIWAKGTW
jgi:hypothetical protein